MYRRGRRIAMTLLTLAALFGGQATSVGAAGTPTLMATGTVGFVGTDGVYVLWYAAEPSDAAGLYAARLDDRQPFFVASIPPYQEVAVSAGVVIWATPDALSAAPTAIHGIDLATHEPFTVIDGDAEVAGLALQDGIAVWREEQRDPAGMLLAVAIRGKHLSSGAEYAIAGGSQVVADGPQLSGTRVVWQERSADAIDIRMRDVATLADAATVRSFPLASGIAHISLDALDGRWLIWTEAYPLESNPTRSMVTLKAQALDGGAVRTLVEPTLSHVALWWKFDLSGDVIVLTLGFTAYQSSALNLAIGQTWDLGATGERALTDGRYVLYDSTELAGRELVGFDLLTDSVFRVRAPGWPDGGPLDATNGVFIWYQQGDSGSELHAARVRDLLPSAPQPPPSTVGQDWVYFPETGHYLGGAFFAFWTRSGGLPIFGYSLTEEFTQHRLTAQFLERQRFEYHPANTGTPYEILLGLLGAEDAAARDLMATPPFQPADPAGGDTQHIYFPETGHWLSSGFLAYWQAHGLELGDPGVSFRESLALFGYPISEEYVDPETGLATQYFERAVFEWHPANDDPYKVLLRRLGAELLGGWGW